MEMIHWCHHEFLVENIIAARGQVNKLAILRHLFVERLIKKRSIALSKFIAKE
jgi:hypothetical protein